MTQVPDYEEFKALLDRVKALEAETAFLRSVLLSRRSLNRKQAATALGISPRTLWEYAKLGKLVPTYEGSKPIYSADLIHEYLTKRNTSQADIEKALIMAIEG